MKNCKLYVKPAVEVIRLDAATSLLDTIVLSSAGDDNGEGTAESKERPSAGNGFSFGDLWNGSDDSKNDLTPGN